MNLRLIRKHFTPESTIGDLYLDDVFECHTLEDTARSVKVHGKTAIPTGRYRVIITYSPRFQQEMPLLLSVPEFLGVRIHAGNVAADTEGCILVGMKWEPDKILESRIAYKGLYDKLDSARQRGEAVWIEITEER